MDSLCDNHEVGLRVASKPLLYSVVKKLFLVTGTITLYECVDKCIYYVA